MQHTIFFYFFAPSHVSNVDLLSTGNCKIINLSEENILWGFKI